MKYYLNLIYFYLNLICFKNKCYRYIIFIFNYYCYLRYLFIKKFVFYYFKKLGIFHQKIYFQNLSTEFNFKR